MTRNVVDNRGSPQTCRDVQVQQTLHKLLKLQPHQTRCKAATSQDCTANREWQIKALPDHQNSRAAVDSSGNPPHSERVGKFPCQLINDLMDRMLVRFRQVIVQASRLQGDCQRGMRNDSLSPSGMSAAFVRPSPVNIALTALLPILHQRLPNTAIQSHHTDEEEDRSRPPPRLPEEPHQARPTLWYPSCPFQRHQQLGQPGVQTLRQEGKASH
eukprot:4467820-Amphidinium_carterae.2